ncbi:MAG TPA: sigma-54 dependent transcriptional regulator, partial [Gemmataceae bacterium]|nr:sigma-54 dependent transcriptional regulator [Gemmataceae bacterium]
ELEGIIGHSAQMAAVFKLVNAVSTGSSTVLIQGESGTGKELVARAIHYKSPRKDKPFLAVNCSALTDTLLDSELFGHIKGAFTGAVDNKTGRFEAAHGGTIFLDEISSMSPKLQVKLLRVLQEREFERVGESRTIRVDTRVIGATNQFLEDEIEAGRFRDDLYYRLNVVPIYLPPLRERRLDVPALTRFFLERYCEENRRDPPETPAHVLERLQNYDWPGNVRELENYVERGVVLSHGQPMNWDAMIPGQERRMRAAHGKAADLDGMIQNLVRYALQKLAHDEGHLHERLVRGVERELLEQVLPLCDNVLVKAAARLGINRNTLHKKMTELKHPVMPAGVPLSEETA